MSTKKLSGKHWNPAIARLLEKRYGTQSLLQRGDGETQVTTPKISDAETRRDLSRIGMEMDLNPKQDSIRIWEVESDKDSDSNSDLIGVQDEKMELNPDLEEAKPTRVCDGKASLGTDQGSLDLDPQLNMNLDQDLDLSNISEEMELDWKESASELEPDMKMETETGSEWELVRDFEMETETGMEIDTNADSELKMEVETGMEMEMEVDMEAEKWEMEMKMCGLEDV